MSVHFFLQSNPVAFITVLFLLGLIVGSFLNVVIYRLPIMMEQDWRAQCYELLKIKDKPNNHSEEKFNLIKPRSRCPKCGHAISAWENIPVISFIILGGKCKECHQPISRRYPVIEFLTGILTAFTAWHFGYGLQALFAILLTWSLICLSMIDIDRQFLPDDITLPILWLGIICNMFGLFTHIYASLIGAIAGYGILWLVFHIFKIITGKEGMGYGDFKLLALLGAWLGWQMLPYIILASSFIGAIIGISLILFRSHDKNIPIPFGPYLAIAGWSALIWGSDITAVYWGWASPA